MMILLGQTDKYFLVSLPLCNPVDLHLGPRLSAPGLVFVGNFPTKFFIYKFYLF